MNASLNSWLEHVQHRGVKLGLDKIHRALELAGSPQRSFQSALVGGTNGKGSTVAFASSILSAAGNRVGATFSPHLTSYEERFRVDGVLATGAELDALARELRPRISSCSDLADFTFFELGVLLALSHFRASGVDAAVVEVGMGGEFDASRACEPSVAALVSVDMDHQQFLGNSIEAIAQTKARIAPPGGILVVGEVREDRLTVIEEQARSVDCELMIAGRDYTWSLEDDLFSYRGPAFGISGVRLGLGGEHQGQNAACALALTGALCDRTGLRAPTEKQCAHALRELRLAGRMERLPALPGRPSFLLDGAHNPAGARVLARSLRSIPRPARRHWLFASMKDKQHAEVVSALLPHVDSVICTAGTSSPRFESPEILAAAIRGLCSEDVLVTSVDTPRAALQRLVLEAGPEDEVLVAGSLYLVGDVRALLGLQPS